MPSPPDASPSRWPRARSRSTSGSRRVSCSTRCCVLADPLLPVGAALLGLCFGSFLNVCILRLAKEDKKDRSLFRPPSSCPHCHRRIAWRDNIPVASWLLLHGKCRWCGQPISAQYPIVEALVGVLVCVRGGVDGWLQGVLGGGVGLGVLFGVGLAGRWILKEEAMGGGDIK